MTDQEELVVQHYDYAMQLVKLGKYEEALKVDLPWSDRRFVFNAIQAAKAKRR